MDNVLETLHKGHVHSYRSDKAHSSQVYLESPKQYVLKSYRHSLLVRCFMYILVLYYCNVLST